MSGDTEGSACDQQKGSDDEGDADGPRIAETFSHYRVGGTGPNVTVRQLRSEGLSFQLWPAATAMCLYIEKEFGEKGMSVIDARPRLLQRGLPHWYSSFAVLEGNPVLGDNFSKGSLDNNLVVDDRICSENDGSVGFCDILERNRRQRAEPNGEPELQMLHDIGRRLAGKDIGHAVDPILANFVIDDGMPLIVASDVSLCDSFERNGWHRPDSNGGPGAQILHEIERPFGSADFENVSFERNGRYGIDWNGGPGTQILQNVERPFASADIDPCLNSLEANLNQATNNSDINGEQVVDKSDTVSIGSVFSRNVHFSIRRMRVLELGSGTGMVGIVAACLGADVVLTDLPHVIPNISYNLDLNKSVVAAAGGSMEARVLRWGVEEDVTALGEESFDLILASDCVYHDTSYKPFLQTLNWLIASDVNRANHSVKTQKPTLPKGTSAVLNSLRGTELLPSHLLGLSICLSPLSKTLMPVADAIDNVVNASEKESQITTGRRSVNNKLELSSKKNELCEKRGGNESVILLGHVRRWKKDSHFFRMAAKCFDVDVVYRHPREENERMGPIVYRLSTKSNCKTSSSSRSRSSSASIRSLPSCSPSRM